MTLVCTLGMHVKPATAAPSEGPAVAAPEDRHNVIPRTPFEVRAAAFTAASLPSALPVTVPVAQARAVCHGAPGLSSAPDARHLAGQPALYLAAQRRAYCSSTRRHEAMNVMARGRSDKDIAQLSAWYSAIRIDVQAPQ